MRNIVLFLLVGLVANICLTEQAFATGGGKGGGKKKNRITVNNTNPIGDRAITVWVVTPEQAAALKTVDDARKTKPRKSVAPGKTESFNVGANSDYVIIAVDTAVYNAAPGNTPIAAAPIDSEIVPAGSPQKVWQVQTIGAAPDFTPDIF